MRLSEERIVEFQRIYKKEFGEDISRADAIEKGTNLARLVKLVYKPFKTKEEYEEFLKWREEENKNEKTGK